MTDEPKVSEESSPEIVEATIPAPARYPQGFLGGILMGLANLVPGISGGTMLLAVGVYPAFIRAVAEVSTFTFRPRSLILLAIVIAGAGLSIVGLAGQVKDLVVEHRWIMYSLFIGLTLGGVPIIWKLIRPMTMSAWLAAACGVAGMIAIALLEMLGAESSAEDASRSYLVLFLAGLAGGSAMILPGVSGGYLLLVLGQYVAILAAISAAKDGALARDWAAIGDALHIIIPVGLGVVAGIVGVSNIIKILLDRFPKATLGFLLGLLIGAVFGLWPFRGLPEEASLVGEVIKGVRIESVEQVQSIPKEDWPVAAFTPGVVHIAGALTLIAAGFVASYGVSRLGKEK